MTDWNQYILPIPDAIVSFKVVFYTDQAEWALHGAAHRLQSNSTNSFQLLRAYLEKERQRKRKTPANPVPKTCGGASWTPPAPGSGLPASVALHGALLRKHEACGEAASVRELWKDKHAGVRVEFRLARSRWRTRPPLTTHHPGFRRRDTSPEKEIFLF